MNYLLSFRKLGMSRASAEPSILPSRAYRAERSVRLGMNLTEHWAEHFGYFSGGKNGPFQVR